MPADSLSSHTLDLSNYLTMRNMRAVSCSSMKRGNAAKEAQSYPSIAEVSLSLLWSLWIDVVTLKQAQRRCQ